MNEIHNLLIFTLLVFNTTGYSKPQVNGEIKYIAINQIEGFNESIWKQPNKNNSPTIRAYNYFFTHKYTSSNGEKAIKRFLFASFVLPNKENMYPDWVLVDDELVKQNLISENELQVKLIQRFNEATSQPSTTVINNDIRPVLFKNGKYYIFKSPHIGQCWQLLETAIETPNEALPSTINIKAKLFSKDQVENYKRSELLKLANATNSRYPLGGENIFADYVFLNQKDNANNLFYFWLTPTVVYDGGDYGSGIEDFLYSPCVGIIGGYFRKYFNALHGGKGLFNKIERKYTGDKPYLGGYHQAYLINNTPAEAYLKKCQSR